MKWAFSRITLHRRLFMQLPSNARRDRHTRLNQRVHKNTTLWILRSFLYTKIKTNGKWVQITSNLVCYKPFFHRVVKYVILQLLPPGHLDLFFHLWINPVRAWQTRLFVFWCFALSQVADALMFAFWHIFRLEKLKFSNQAWPSSIWLWEWLPYWLDSHEKVFLMLLGMVS